MPDGVARVIERLQASFLWGGSEVRRKVHMVKWSKLTKSLEQGGLGLRRVKVVNSCLLIKWWWRFGYEKNALWRSVICSKYKVDFRD